MKRRFATILAVGLVLCIILTACKKDSGDLNAGDIYTPEETSGAGDETAPEAGAEEKVDYSRVYDPIIAEWKSAYENIINGGDPYGEGLSFGFYSMGDSDAIKAYYALYDIDGNGTPELILRKENSYEDIIAYIFSISDGTALNIFGYDDEGSPREVPWSRIRSSAILSNGLIDSTAGDYAIYEISDDGCTVTKVASSEPFDYPDEAHLAQAKWKYYIYDTLADYDDYVRHLNAQGYTESGDNTLAIIDWENVNG